MHIVMWRQGRCLRAHRRWWRRATSLEHWPSRGNRRSTPTFTPIPFAGGEPPAGAWVADQDAARILAILDRYKPIESCAARAEYRPACCRPAPISVATSLSPHTARLRKTPGRPWGSPRRGSGADFENAVVELRRCRLQCSSWNDIGHGTEGMRSSNDPEPERHGRVLTDTMPTRPADAVRREDPRRRRQPTCWPK